MHNRDDDSTNYSESLQGTPTTRDERGRWLKGHCPNRKGRPKKKRLVDLDPTDLRWFANTLIEVRRDGKPVLMTRKAILYEKIFESATKRDKVSMQKFLYEKFEANDKRHAEFMVWCQDLFRRWILDNPDWRKPGYELPERVANDIAAVREILKHYYPGTFGEDEADEI